MGQGQFSLVVSLRDKLRRGEKLESWEREYCRRNPGLKVSEIVVAEG